jgi:c-di-GMP-related signal transduction protein
MGKIGNIVNGLCYDLAVIVQVLQRLNNVIKISNIIIKKHFLTFKLFYFLTGKSSKGLRKIQTMNPVATW